MSSVFVLVLCYLCVGLGWSVHAWVREHDESIGRLTALRDVAIWLDENPAQTTEEILDHLVEMAEEEDA